MLRRKFLGVLALYAFTLPTLSIGRTVQVGASTTPVAPAKAVYSAPKEVIDKIRDEGMNHSQVMQTLSYLTDVIGQRLTGSPSFRRANEWTRDTMTKWGLAECPSRSLGTVRPRLGAEELFGAGLAAVRHSADRLSKGMGPERKSG